MSNDTRERNFELVKKKLKSLSRRSVRVLDGALMGDGNYSHAQILSAEAVLKLNTMFSIHGDKESAGGLAEETLL